MNIEHPWIAGCSDVQPHNMRRFLHAKTLGFDPTKA